jgi:HEAT repeat protein
MRDFYLFVACSILTLPTEPAYRRSAAAQVEEPQPVYEGKPLSEWLKLLNDDDVRVRRRAIAVLKTAVSAQMREDWDEAQWAIPFFDKALKDADQGVRATAANALYDFGRGPEAEAEVARLIIRLKDPDPDIRYRAAQLLSVSPHAAEVAAPALAKALRDEDVWVRRRAAFALGLQGLQSKATVPLLVEALKDRSAFAMFDCHAMLAAKALRRIGPDAGEAVPALTTTLQSRFPWDRREAALALGAIGPAARTALPELRRALRDEAVDVRAGAAVAVWCLDRQAREVLPILIEVVRTYAMPGPARLEPPTVKAALHAMGEMSREARPAIPALVPLLKEKAGGIHRAAAAALKEIDAEVGQKQGAEKRGLTTPPALWIPGPVRAAGVAPASRPGHRRMPRGLALPARREDPALPDERKRTAKGAPRRDGILPDVQYHRIALVGDGHDRGDSGVRAVLQPVPHSLTEGQRELPGSHVPGTLEGKAAGSELVDVHEISARFSRQSHSCTKDLPRTICRAAGVALKDIDPRRGAGERNGEKRGLSPVMRMWVPVCRTSF